MKVFLTGPGGFLGKHLCKMLLEEDHEVTGFSRGDYPELREMGITLCRGDLQNYGDIIASLDNHDVIIHTASKVGMWGKWEDFYNINVVGTLNLLKAAREKKINKFIYTSSPSVVYGNCSIKGADESTPYPKEYLSLYAKSKAQAEKIVLESNSDSLATVSLRPHLIFGPGDPHIIPRLIKRAKSGRLRIVGDGKNQVDVIHVENVVHAHLLAMDKIGKGIIDGHPYFLGQEKEVKLWPFINKLLNNFEVRPVTKKIGLRSAFKIGSALESTYKILGIKNNEPPMTRFVALQLGTDHYFSHKRAKNELGYEPIINLDDAIASVNPNSVRI